MHRARGLWRPPLPAAFGASRALPATPGPGSGPPEAHGDPGLVRFSSPELERRLRGLAGVRARFVSEEEAAELLREVEPALRRGRYQRDHWDRAITGYRETERDLGGVLGGALLARVAPWFPPQAPPRARAHVLDLEPGGAVGAHVDSTKFWGPLELSMLRGAARFEFTHEILPDPESFFGGLRVPRGRRVALIFRNDPPETPPDPLGDLPAFIEDPREPPDPK
ncbi:alpha-ketoglutarate-dependent dioxygenase alkB homolog 7, mitochondrial [Camarhynchus parvulus]|uniref:alpha-ketoglutarate-dependent dioxygenase alkB homolog 7, mitochondrial n=1 Tax=Geospiza parvula TaxID=87175 RepID=UPI001237FCCF|nr:alpha-ketoglutarate-dependent dioxygenase alkB homolog 7, mitochondrial [Camarhynchus parvulus]